MKKLHKIHPALLPFSCDAPPAGAMWILRNEDPPVPSALDASTSQCEAIKHE